ncbi:MAG: response regulator [Proteobacteria bacterium]|nr:response regulator [Pseudomonadota bacterium]MBU1586118.1 response regulator [Pseudomonadota bacterium]MBU2455678.1 response regulator [Pseudomonadota bacterium]
MNNPRILIVDDSITIRKSMITLLNPFNATIIEAKNGQEGFELAEAGNFDIILSDIEMPVMNGIEFCRRIKENPKTRNIPIVVVSSFDSGEDINLGFQVGAAAYITKDEAKELLYNTIKDILLKTSFKRERTILIVDDSISIRRIVQKGLERSGFQVLTAENGKEALYVLNKTLPDMILSDIDMPVMNGYKFCEAVRLKHELKKIPFMVMSANSDRGNMNRMIQQGAVAYICKPFNIDQLVIMVEKILSDQFLILLKEKERIDNERDLMIATIASLVTALEARDAYTRGHSEAVGEIISGMLKLTGASKTEVETAFIGGRLHDIGKIGIRDDILLKPGRLTEVEFAQIMKHPDIGAEILKSIPSLADTIPIVRYHHERMDGKGYPQGLKGSKIPVLARMTAVADTYHSLTSNRPYRKESNIENALQIIDDVKGIQLCPDCVSLFLDYIDKKGDNGTRLAGTLVNSFITTLDR